MTRPDQGLREQPEMRPYSEIRPDFRSAVGKTFGQLTVLGLAVKTSARHGALWVARCSCGMYALRRLCTLRKNRDADHCCDGCRHDRHIAYLKASGQYVPR